MDLLSSLNPAQWQNASPKEVQGLKEFAVVRCKPLAKGKYEISIRENVDDAEVKMAVLDGVQSKNNPLASVRNIELKVDEAKPANIVAINLEDDCVVRK
jgi:hypothetical protein